MRYHDLRFARHYGAILSTFAFDVYRYDRRWPATIR